MKVLVIEWSDGSKEKINVNDQWININWPRITNRPDKTALIFANPEAIYNLQYARVVSLVDKS